MVRRSPVPKATKAATPAPPLYGASSGRSLEVLPAGLSSLPRPAASAATSTPSAEDQEPPLHPRSGVICTDEFARETHPAMGTSSASVPRSSPGFRSSSPACTGLRSCCENIGDNDLVVQSSEPPPTASQGVHSGRTELAPCKTATELVPRESATQLASRSDAPTAQAAPSPHVEVDSAGGYCAVCGLQPQSVAVPPGPPLSCCFSLFGQTSVRHRRDC
jgi:hypothetical protein